MINYPYLRLFKTYIKSIGKEPIDITDESDLNFRAGLFDIDPYLEVNNGRYHTLGDIARFNHGFRSDFYKYSRIHGITFTLAGATAKYRHRIPFLKKFEMRTKIVYTDYRWVYYMTDFHSNERLSSSILARTGCVKNGRLISTEDSARYFKLKVPKYELPEWVSLWIQSDSKYPGFK